MKKVNTNPETRVLLYESPKAVFIEVKAEGILCASCDNDDVYNELKFQW